LVAFYLNHLTRIDLSHYHLLLHDLPTSAFYPLSLHDALPICLLVESHDKQDAYHQQHQTAEQHCTFFGNPVFKKRTMLFGSLMLDRKSTRLNSSHVSISYAVFCLKKKKNKTLFSCSKYNQEEC